MGNLSVKPRVRGGRAAASAAGDQEVSQAELVFDRLWQVSLSVFVPSEDVPIVFKPSSKVLSAMSKETSTFISPPAPEDIDGPWAEVTIIGEARGVFDAFTRINAMVDEVDDVVVSFNLHHAGCQALKSVIPSVSAQFGVRIDVPKAEVPGGVRVVIMEGDANAVAGAFDLMTNTISTKVGNVRTTHMLHIPADKVGMVVGKQGSMVKRLQNATGGSVNMASSSSKNRHTKGGKEKHTAAQSKRGGKKGARSRGGSNTDAADAGFDTASDGGDLSSVDEHSPRDKKSVLQVPTPQKKGAASDEAAPAAKQQGVVLTGPTDSVHMLAALIADLLGPDGHMSEARAQDALFKAGRPFLSSRPYFAAGRYKDAQLVWLQRSGAQAEEREKWHPEVEAAAREELGLPPAEEDQQAPDASQEWDVVWLRQQQAGPTADVHIQRGATPRAPAPAPAPAAPPAVPDSKVRAGRSFADILAEQSAARAAAAAPAPAPAAARGGSGGGGAAHAPAGAAASHSGSARDKHDKGGSHKEGGARGQGKNKGGKGGNQSQSGGAQSHKHTKNAHKADSKPGKTHKADGKPAAEAHSAAAPKRRGGKQQRGGDASSEASAAKPNHKPRAQGRGKHSDGASVSSGSSRGGGGGAGRGRGRGGGGGRGRGRGRGGGGGVGGAGAGAAPGGAAAQGGGSKRGGGGGRGNGGGRRGGRGRGRGGGGGRGRGGGSGGSTTGAA